MSRRFIAAYETEDTLAQEQEVCELLAQRGLIFEKLPPREVVDFAILGEKGFIGFMEVKSRTCASDKFETYMLSMAKFMRMKQLVTLMGIPTVLVVKFTDRIMKLWIYDKTPHYVEIGGRRDRADPDDLEPVVHLKMDLFKELDLEQGVAS